MKMNARESEIPYLIVINKFCREQTTFDTSLTYRRTSDTSIERRVEF
jgi:hypothetical protein